MQKLIVRLQWIALGALALLAGIGGIHFLVELAPMSEGSTPVQTNILPSMMAMIVLVAFTILRMITDDAYLAAVADATWRATHSGLIFWFLLTVWALLSTIWAYVPERTLYDGALMLLEMGFLVFIITTVSRGAFQWVCVLFLAGALPKAVLGIIQVFNGGPLGLSFLGEVGFNPANPYGFGPELFRPYGLSNHPSIFAGYMSIAVIIGLLLALTYKQNWKASLAVYAVVLVFYTALIFSSSRNAIALTTAFMFPALFFAYRPRGKTLWITLGAAGAGLAIVIGVLAVTPVLGQIYQRFYEMLGDPEASLDRILEGVPNTMAVFRTSPIIGVGVQNLVPAMVELSLPGDRFGLYLPAHNVYVVVLAELGIVGLVLYVLALWNLLRFLFARNALLFLGAAGVFTLSTLIVFDFYFWTPFMRAVPFWLLGMMWGLEVQRQQTAETSPQQAPKLQTRPDMV